MNIKYLLFFVVLILKTTSYAQVNRDSSGFLKIEEHSHLKSITLGKKNIELPAGSFVDASPNGEKVAILDLTGNNNAAVVSIYNSNGEITGKYSVSFLSELALADDGRFALFGISESLSTITSLEFYDKDGKFVKKETETFNDRIIASFSGSGDYFILLASKEVVVSKKQIPVKLIVYDKQYNRKGQYLFKDWSRLSSFQKLQINETRKQIKLFRWAGEEDHLLKETVVVDFKCKLMSVEKGWNR